MSAVERITNTRKYTQLFKGEELNFDGIVFRFYELFL